MRAWAFSAGGIDASARLMTGSGPLRGGYRVSLTCILVERREGLVLIDTGWGSPTVDSSERFPGWLFDVTAGRARAGADETARGHVVALGFRPEDVRDIVVTHLDIDHVGGLVDFPEARVHVSRLEHAARFHRRQPFRSRIHDSRPAFAHGPRFVVADLVEHEELGFPRTADLFGDGTVVLLDSSGHTPGHCGVLVRTDEAALVHAGDTVVHARELLGEEDLPLGVRLYRRILHEDKAGVARSLARFRALRRERPDIRIVNAHDASLLASLPAFPAPLVAVD
jgi:glyoxylase-like metal-dependent hydrolase (beta-lactamase superfamily II)